MIFLNKLNLVKQLKILKLIFFSTTFLFLLSPICANNTLKLSVLTIISSNTSHNFLVEIADTPILQSKGLQGRTHLELNKGMLFYFKKTKFVSMWMKNTFIPLDMIFILADGTISEINASSQPNLEKIIESSFKVKAVLEIKGGLSNELKLKPGDRIEHNLFNHKKIDSKDY